MTIVKRGIFDLESNGLLDTVDRIHCICIKDLDTGDMHSFTPDNIEEGVKLLQEMDYICGHNVIAYDIPAIQIVYPWFKPVGKIEDTLVLSRLIKADLLTDDAMDQSVGLAKRLWGSHSLKAWGIRTQKFKGDYDGGWETFSQEMLDYCKQDVELTTHIYDMFLSSNFSEESIDLEHEKAHVCLSISNAGWTFDVKKAGDLYAKLSRLRADLEDELQDLFEPWTVETEFIPKVNNKSRGYVKGEVFIKKKVVEFNPNSRIHIHKCLVDKYGWKPTQYSAQGAATIDDTILAKLHYPEAKKLATYFILQKRIAQLAEGKAAWLKLVDSKGILRHNLIPNGTISSRCSARSPNLQQVPRVSAPHGKECRELFTAPEGWVIMGSDLSGIELRCLSHVLDDNGEYAEQILEGDIHTYNQHKFGCKSRDISKRLIYSLIYGGGDKLLGEVVGSDAKEGRRLKTNYDRSVPAFARLKRDLSSAAKRGYLIGLDGRHLYIRSAHRQLSQLLQSSGAIIAAKWVCKIHREIERNFKNDAFIMGWIHDEVQIACKPEVAEDVGSLSLRMAEETGNHFKMSIPITAEFNIGRTWAETH